jgi:hypothetical protein
MNGGYWNKARTLYRKSPIVGFHTVILSQGSSLDLKSAKLRDQPVVERSLQGSLDPMMVDSLLLGSSSSVQSCFV